MSVAVAVELRGCVRFCEGGPLFDLAWLDGDAALCQSFYDSSLSITFAYLYSASTSLKAEVASLWKLSVKCQER